VAVAAQDRTISARHERKFGDLVTTIAASPVTLHHLARATISTKAWAIGTCGTVLHVALLAEYAVRIAGLERELLDFLTALFADPVSLHHLARSTESTTTLSAEITIVHRDVK
jgi:multisubunit Na+/H+ antiporter MnhG subunit